MYLTSFESSLTIEKLQAEAWQTAFRSVGFDSIDFFQNEVGSFGHPIDVKKASDSLNMRSTSYSFLSRVGVISKGSSSKNISVLNLET